MTKISLRVYNHEIEGMIEGGQVEEAIAHCQHILKTFPMHLETYRLLGKAFLETRRYVDAADIFQRVLMSVPEDFVSHVGMSIIRDDENKLDEAIWHMERAFEVQPSNPAIQDELRKLYGRRDGVQPPKVRLTRDALANMYAQGALYSQAIAEIRAVLADDPNRPDLQVMLARAYSKDGRKKQAIEICTELLKKYPYCFDALRILIDLMPPSDQHEFTQTYRLRVKALDPYTGFVTGSIFSSDNVPDIAVNIELLDYDPNDKESGSQPAWASSLGIKLESDKGQMDVPEWLSEKSNDVLPVSEPDNQPHAIGVEKEESAESVDVPDWMRSSGWEKSTDPVVENSGFDDLENEEPQLAKAEIPEWLKEMAPGDDELLEPDKLPDGFESMLVGNATDLTSQDNIMDLAHEPGLHETIMKKNVSEGNIPDWMKDDEINEPIQLESTPSLGSQKLEPYQDGFIALSSEELQEESEEPLDQPADDISSWLGEVKEESIDSGIQLREIGNNEDDLPGWLKDIGSEKLVGEIDRSNEYSNEIQDQSEGISTSGEQIEPELRTTQEEDLPEWLKDIGSELAIGELDQTNEPINEFQIPADEDSSELNQVTSELEVTAEENLPDWLKDIGLEKPVNYMDLSKGPISEMPEQSEKFSTTGDQISLDVNATVKNDLPDWLNEIDTTHETETSKDELSSTLGVEEETYSLFGEEEAIPILPESMPAPAGLVLEEEVHVPASGDPSLEGKSLDNELPSMEDQDAAMAWLEGLAAKQGAKAEELLTKPEDRSDEPPEWVRKSIEGDPKSFDDETIISKPLDPDTQPSSLVDEISPEQENQQERFKMDQERVDNTKLDFDSSQDKDDSIWLKELHANEPDDMQDPIVPKISEFYGDEISEPLPDWLKEIEKDPSSSEWIAEAERSPEPFIGNSEPTPISNEKDIDDIGEIFPADSTNWNFEDSEADSILEPIDEVVKPVTASDWQPIQPDQKLPDEESTDIPKTVSAVQTNGSPIRNKPIGTGRLSKIPARDIEKEAGTLEQAQYFIEKGEIKKAIEAYSRLVKKGQLLEGVIHDLREITYRYPVEIDIWQLLGDAYMRVNRLQDALDAYTKAEGLLR